MQYDNYDDDHDDEDYNYDHDDEDDDDDLAGDSPKEPAAKDRV